MKIGIPKEIKNNENRVGMTPAGVAEFIRHGHEVMVQHTAKGRIDITMETADTIYVMELKFNKSAEEALAQIEAKHYVDAFKMSGKKMVKIGLNFSVKDEVNSLEWKIES